MKYSRKKTGMVGSIGSRKSVGHLAALCFVTWNLAVKALGAVKTSVYIYMVPVITVVTSVLVLKEPVTWISNLGTVMAVARLFFSEYSGKENRKNE